MRTENMAYVTGFTFVVTFVMAIILSFVHFRTTETVRTNELERRQATVLAALGIPANSQEEVFAAYAALERIDLSAASDETEYLYRFQGSDGVRFARQFSGPGIWGDIVAVLSVNANATRIIGVEILDQNETPGLGGRVTNRSFLDQFNGELLAPDGIYVAVRGPGDTDPDNGKIDGITGATGTTRAFDRMLNQELRSLRQIVPDRIPAGRGRSS
ncbi:MAG: FMN-binding protein [Spirochaeta sp.]|jgi:Na+-transporting NADH:ubiquinone oxidoreductase subunit C|nr:FMN-binding protein [Spirochaeta sp.]